MQEGSQFQLPLNIVKSLTDKNEDKKESSWKELEIIVRKNSDKKNYHQIQNIIKFFKEKYTHSSDNNKKKAGLQTLPSVVNGIKNSNESTNRFAKEIVSIILECLNDNEHKIRFTALKSLYYIAKSLQERIIKMFNQIFQHIISKINDLDQQVRSAAIFLDKHLHTVLNQALSSSQNVHDFNLKQFMGIVKSKLKSMSPGVKDFLIKWINNLNEISSINLLVYLPDLLEDLLFMLGDKEKTLRINAEECLHNFKKEMKDKFNEGKLEEILKQDIINEILTYLITVAKKKSSSYTKLEALAWMQVIFNFFKQQILIPAEKTTQKLIFKKIIIERFDEVLCPILLLMSHEEEDVRKASLATNQLLMQNIQLIDKQENINFNKVMPLIKDMLSEKKSTSTSESALRWMKFMLENYNDKDKIVPEINDIIEKLAEKLCYSNVKNVISVIENTKVREEYTELLIERMLILLLNKSSTESQYKPEQVLRKFSAILQSDKFCKSFCIKLCNSFEDKKFIFEMVQHLNHLIITEKTMQKIRKQLQEFREPEHAEFFLILFNAFKYNPAAATSLCLLSQQYSLAYRILIMYGDQFQLSSSVLMGFCKLAVMIQSTGFLFLRMQILQKSNNPYLIESLTALLMILPQGKIFNMLKNRIDVSKVLGNNSNSQRVELNGNSGNGKKNGKEDRKGIDVEFCLKEYRDIHNTISF